jgi:hypothetical protein
LVLIISCVRLVLMDGEIERVGSYLPSVADGCIVGLADLVSPLDVGGW